MPSLPMNQIITHPHSRKKASISVSQLTSLTSFYLYSAVRYFFEHQLESSIDQLISDVPVFCGHIRDSVSSEDTDKICVSEYDPMSPVLGCK